MGPFIFHIEADFSPDIMMEHLQRLKQRRNILLRVIQLSHKAAAGDLCKHIVSYEHLIKLLSMLAANEENLLKSVLPQETEEETHG